MKKRLILFSLIYLLIFIYFSGCGDDNTVVTPVPTSNTLGTKDVYVFAPAVSNTKLTAGQEAEFKKTGLTAIFENSAPSSYIPVSGATVTIGDATGTTDGTGHVLLTGIPYGLYDMMVEHPDYDFFHQEIPVANPGISATEFTNPRIIPEGGVNLIPSLMQFHAVADTNEGIVELSGTWTSEETETNTTESKSITGSGSKGLFAINPDNGISFIDTSVENCLAVSVGFTHNNVQSSNGGSPPGGGGPGNEDWSELIRKILFVPDSVKIEGEVIYPDGTPAVPSLVMIDKNPYGSLINDDGCFSVTAPVRSETDSNGLIKFFAELEVHAWTTNTTERLDIEPLHDGPRVIIIVVPFPSDYVTPTPTIIPTPIPTNTPSDPSNNNMQDCVKSSEAVYPHFSGNSLNINIEFNTSVISEKLNMFGIFPIDNPDLPIWDMKTTSSAYVTTGTFWTTKQDIGITFEAPPGTYITADDIFDIFLDFNKDHSGSLPKKVRVTCCSDGRYKGYIDVTLK